MGAASEPPRLTEPYISSIAFSTTTLPAVSPVSWIACSIGTPEDTAPEKVRDQRARATFCTTSPILNGMCKVNLPQMSLPRSVFFQRKKAKINTPKIGSRKYQELVRTLE